MKKVVGLYAIQKKSDVASASASTFEPTLCGMWVAHTSGRRRSGVSSRVESKGSFDSVRYEYTRVFVFVSLCVCVHPASSTGRNARISFHFKRRPSLRGIADEDRTTLGADERTNERFGATRRDVMAREAMGKVRRRERRERTRRARWYLAFVRVGERMDG